MAPAAGMLLADVAPGAAVREGSRLGVIRDFHGEELARIVAPEDGIVAGIHMAGAINVNDLAVTLFHPAG